MHQKWQLPSHPHRIRNDTHVKIQFTSLLLVLCHRSKGSVQNGAEEAQMILSHGMQIRAEESRDTAVFSALFRTHAVD